MTHTKIERLRGEMLGKYGDKVIVMLFSRKDGTPLKVFSLSDIPIRCTADMKSVQKVLSEGKPRHIYV